MLHVKGLVFKFQSFAHPYHLLLFVLPETPLSRLIRAKRRVKDSRLRCVRLAARH
jgi:hypothetical protein